MRTCVRLALVLGVVGVLLVVGGETGASPGITEPVSLSSAGADGTGPSEYPAISADGRYVAFHSSATNLVANDTNGGYDVFVRDRQMGATERVSVSSGSAQGIGDSLSPAINSDGGYVAFVSWAPNLVTGDTEACELEQTPPEPPIPYNCPDIFVRNRQAGTTERVSLSSAEDEANGESWSPALSADGRYVAFYSGATNLVSGDTNNVEDVFVRDRQAGTTVRISLASGGTQANGASDGWLALSDSGRFVAFTSDATNLVAGDTNGAADVFLRDRDTDGDGTFDETGAVSTTRVSVDSSGTQSNGESYYAAISGDGHYVAFGSAATNLVGDDTNGSSDIFLHDRQASTTTRVSLDSAGVQGNAGSFEPAVSADGDYVGFYSGATNLVDGDTNAVGDIFLRIRSVGATTRVSVDSFGAQGNGASTVPVISGDGRYVAFESVATNLVPGEINGYPDVFVRDRQTSTTELVSVGLPVGGIAELPAAARDSGSPVIDPTLLAGLAAVALALLSAGAWYARRRSRQS
jgi:Tol biopolymer transport system component